MSTLKMSWTKEKAHLSSLRDESSKSLRLATFVGVAGSSWEAMERLMQGNESEDGELIIQKRLIDRWDCLGLQLVHQSCDQVGSSPKVLGPPPYRVG